MALKNSSGPQVRIGTRASALARWQAEWVAQRLRDAKLDVELVLITTRGDLTDRSLNAEGGQGLFTKEIQRALLDNRIDLAVHSLKDLPTDVVEGLKIAAIPGRESPCDVLVTKEARSLEELPVGSRVGTGSRRRQSQLLHWRADLQVLDIRGNVDSRLRKLDEGQYDAIVLAEAGLNRLGLTHRISQLLSPSVMLPAVGQGALGLEIRVGDAATEAAVMPLDDPNTRVAVLAERSMLRDLRAGCLAPVGAWGRIANGRLLLSGAVLSPDGRRRVSVALEGTPQDPETLGRQAAQELRSLGADALIDASRR